jgi:hypothetical protein
MLGLKNKRRMVRNPYMKNGFYYPYQGYPQNGQPLQQPFIQSNFSASQQNVKQQPIFMNQGYTPFQMPYPKQAGPVAPPKPNGMQSILEQFKTKDGGYDFNKMMNTAGQMMNTVNQLNGMVKQVGSLFKTKV